MKIIIKPEKIIVQPAQYAVEFYESREYSDYVDGSSYETMNNFRPDITSWLDANAPGWSASFDRGDLGEGPAVVIINFTEETHAKEFYALYNAIPCPNVQSIGHCPNIHLAIKQAKNAEDLKSKCEECGYEICLYKDTNND